MVITNRLGITDSPTLAREKKNELVKSGNNIV